jgi:hypothetical protein
LFKLLKIFDTDIFKIFLKFILESGCTRNTLYDALGAQDLAKALDQDLAKALDQDLEQAQPLES